MIRRKILIVAMAESVHTARWLEQLTNTDFDIYLFPSYDDGVIRVHPNIINNPKVTVCFPYHNIYYFFKKVGLFKFYNFLYTLSYKIKSRFNDNYHAKRLAHMIRVLKPELIHSLETQRAGYLVQASKSNFPNTNSFPTWWHTNWGSDIFLFGRMPAHQPLIKKVMESCDYYSCECHRDIDLAKSFGFKGHSFPVYPNGGGFNPTVINDFRSRSVSTAQRKIIMLKGYQGWAGRALVGIRALEKCADIIGGYKIVIYSSDGSEDIEIASTLLSQNACVKVEILPMGTTHEQILAYHSHARISIGLSIGDAISTSLLEAMAMGSFPIQSCTACASEWFENGISGLIVTPEDPEIVESAIRMALLDDNLVNTAAEINLNKIIDNANYEKLQRITIDAYRKALNFEIN